MEGEGSHRRRRRHHRSRSRGHHGHRRHHDGGAGDVSANEGERELAAEEGQGPPAEWHGSSGAAHANGGYGFHDHEGLSSPFGLPPGHPPPGWLPPPDVQYEAAQEDPYGFPFAAVPPPAGMDTSFWKGGSKGKGKARSSPYGVTEGSRIVSDSLTLSNVPPEVNTLDALNRHFRRFGQVLKMTTNVAEGKALVQFASREAAEAAAVHPVLDIPDIVLAWAIRPVIKGKGKGKGLGKGKGGVLERKIENRVLVSDPEEQRRLDEAKRKKDELLNKRAALLGSFTDQMKLILTKLNDENLSEEKREQYKTLLLAIKAKLDALTLEGEPGKPGAKGKGKGAPAPQGKFTLDLRTKVLRIGLPPEWTLDRLKEELRKAGTSNDQIAQLYMDPTSTEQAAAAILRFKDRAAAERLFNHRSDTSCYIEWCTQPPPAPTSVTAAVTRTAEEDGSKDDNVVEAPDVEEQQAPVDAPSGDQADQEAPAEDSEQAQAADAQELLQEPIASADESAAPGTGTSEEEHQAAPAPEG